MSILFGIFDRLVFLFNRLRERLWVKPLLHSLVLIAAVFFIKDANLGALEQIVPEISVDTVNQLLSIMASSMLIIATFSVGSMVTAYASASNTTTPRCFTLVIADDVSQNALSCFVAAFIFSIVALIAVGNNYFQAANLFALFVMTMGIFAFVIGTFIRWVDRIARLGRMGSTIEKVEEATAKALKRRRSRPTLNGVPVRHSLEGARPVFSAATGYVQRVDIAALQEVATKVNGRIAVAALPGKFVAVDQPLAFVKSGDFHHNDERVIKAFVIGKKRTFIDDPRFGLIVLSQIAARSLSPAVNDPGTAIDIIGTLVRLFSDWTGPGEAEDSVEPTCDRVDVPEIKMHDMFDDAFTCIARDGAGMIEVATRLQKAFRSLGSLNDADIRAAAIHHSRMALMRSEKAPMLPEEIALIRECAGLASGETWQPISSEDNKCK